MEENLKLIDRQNNEVTEDFWGLGERSLLILEDLIENLLK